MLKAHKGKVKAHQCIIIALKIIQKKASYGKKVAYLLVH